MQKSAVFLALVGALIGIGIILSFYGSQIITEGLISVEDNLRAGDSLEISADLDPSISKNGVIVVQIMNFKQGTIVASIFDPFGIQILSKLIDRDSFQNQFEIASKGTYRLLIKNLGDEDSQIIGVIGNMPDSTKLSIGKTGFYVLIAGLIGIVGLGIYAVKNRRKRISWDNYPFLWDHQQRYQSFHLFQ